MDAFELVGKLTLDASSFNAGLNTVEAEMNSGENTGKFTAWGTFVGNLAATAFTKAFSAAKRLASDMLRVGMDFEATMSSVKAVGNLTDEEFTKVEKKAMELGESTKFTAEEVGEAFYYMGLAGWNSEEMLAGIEPVLSLAAASGENLGRVSDIVTDAITAMGLTAKDAAEFVDVLAAASTNSNTTVGMMGEAFKYLATTGGVLEYSIQDVATVLGLLANNGIKASQAGTSMRQILNTLIAPTDKAADAMSALGISLFEVGTNRRKPLLQVVQELRDAFKEAGLQLDEGFDPEHIQEEIDKINEWYDEAAAAIEADTNDTRKGKDKRLKNLDELYAQKIFGAEAPNQAFLQKLSAIGGLRGISSLFALMKSTDEDFDQLVDSVENSEGAAQQMAEIMIDNLEGDVTLLNSALDGLKLLVYSTYKDDFRVFVQSIIAEVGELSKAFNEGGLAGMFTNLTDWMINGITDTLTNPEITVEGANKFGEALGEFVGNLVKNLVTNAPELVTGLFTAGMNLAGGIVQGLFAGLFGVGDNSVYGFLKNAGDKRDDLIEDANKTAVEANGIVGYMESLVDKYGEAAKESGEWASSLEKLEQLIPGITSSISAEGEALSTTTGNMREYIEQSKQLAIEQAKEAYVGDLRSKYRQKLVEQGEAEVYRDLASSTMGEAAAQLAKWASMTGAANEESLIAGFEEGTISFDQLSTMAYAAANELGLSTSEIAATIQAYNEAERSYNDNVNKLNSMTAEIQALQAQLQIAEAAVASMASAASSAASSMSTGLSSGAYYNWYYGGGGSHASGAWSVPYDNYRAILHRGERVLTASQARKQEESNGISEAALVNAMRGAFAEMAVEMDGEGVGRISWGRTSRMVSDNLAQMNRRHRYGYGG